MAGTGVDVALPIRCAPELQDLTLWRQYVSQLRELYLTRNQTLKQVKKAMEEQHGWPEFNTYEVVLRDELKLVKNLKKDDWVAIQHHLKKRERVPNKRSEVIFHGRAIDRKRIAKETRRYRSAAIRRAMSPSLRDGLCIRTPPPLSPRLPALQSSRGVQMATMNRPPSNVISMALQAPTTNQIISTSRYRHMTPEAILGIRANAPFNQFAMKLQDIWLSSTPSMHGTRYSSSCSQTLAGSTPTHELNLNEHNNAHHPPLLDILRGCYQIATTRAQELTGTNSCFGTLMQAFYMFSNDIFNYDSKKELMDWIGLVADIKLLEMIFGIRLPTVTAAWENLILTSWQLRHGKAFEILLEIGLAVDHGRLMQSRVPKYFALAVYLGSKIAVASVRRLLRAGVQPDTPFLFSYLHEWEWHRCGGWCSCALERAAKQSDAEMMKVLINAGASPTGKFDNKYGNALLSMAAGTRQSTGETSCLQCVELLINAGVKVDAIPEHHRMSAVSTAALAWKGPDRPRLMIDHLFLSIKEESRDAYECIARHSQWWKNSVTVSGIFQATEGGLSELQIYLDSMAIPNPAEKQALLQIALSEAAYRNAVTVVLCLLQFGIDPDVKVLMAIVPEDERRSWKPVLRAAESWNSEVLATLLEHGSSCQQLGIFEVVVDRRCEPGFDYSRLQDKRSLALQILLDAGVNIDVSPERLLLAALTPMEMDIDERQPMDSIHHRQYLDYVGEFQPDSVLCNKLQQHGISFDLEMGGVNTLQMVLRAGCNFATADFLIRSGVRVHSVTHESHRTRTAKQIGDTTMLHDALLYATVDLSRLVSLLLRNGADISASTSNGISILEASLHGPSTHSMSVTMDKNHYKERLSVFWELFRSTGIHCGSSLEFKIHPLVSRLVELSDTDANIYSILESGVNVDSADPETGYSLLMQAIRHDRIGLVEQLIQRDCDVNFRVDSISCHLAIYNTALEAACSHSQESVVQLLLVNGANINSPPGRTYLTALQAAINAGDFKIVTILLQHGVDVNAKPGIDASVPFFGSRHLNMEFMKGKWLAVDGAVSVGHLDMVHLLVEAGALSGHPGDTGLDGAMYFAKRSNRQGILEYLVQHTHREYSTAMRPPTSTPSSERSSSSDGDDDGEENDRDGPEMDISMLDLEEPGSADRAQEKPRPCSPVASKPETEAVDGAEYLEEEFSTTKFNDQIVEVHSYDSPGAQRIVEWAQEVNRAFS